MKKFTFYLVITLVAFTSGVHYLSAQTLFFYGTTKQGGNTKQGTIFKFDPVADTESVVWSFGSTTNDGVYPQADLIYDANTGLFYGTTLFGGSYDINDQRYGGTIISFDPVTNRETVVWNFGGTLDGWDLSGNLILDPDNGLFYTMTVYGGNKSYYQGSYYGGTIVSFNTNTNKDSVVWNFGSGMDGKVPNASLLYNASNGLLYGMTTYGGTNSYGAIISFNTVTNTDSVHWSFPGGATDGRYPWGNLVYDSLDGLFYATTTQGGSADSGAIISFDPITNKDTLVWTFGIGQDGKIPRAGLVYNSVNGLFYGTTSIGGTSGNGTIFSFDPVTNKESVVWNFAGGLGGGHPNGNLVLDTINGLYYGTAAGGGVHDTGTLSLNGGGIIFSFDPSDNNLQVVWNFGDRGDGKSPLGSLTAYTLNMATGNNMTSRALHINIYPNPTTGKLIIDGLSTGQMVELYNYMGQKINTWSANNATQQLDISSLAEGMYVILVLNKDGSAAEEKKIVKQD